ncbi:hypothetical protein [Nitrosomonas sp. Nm33]|uniref:hypothetical protein n=1 Tax=Nitrosomonas sp. Nm33 TaxID=133724 RepID=UPI000897B4E6|nr:hypothetical protein [Nitrosomonas sp. Nm33]SDY68736.1 hypothetical protein SAMN05421755_103925 [Nitrosomonas sp. Nm33]
MTPLRKNAYHSNDILSKITPHLKGVIRRQNGGLLAFCPGHNDRKSRSLAVNVGDDGRVLLKCFAGCSIHEITSAMGLSVSDLFPDTSKAKYDPQSRAYFQEWQILEALAFDAAVLLIAARRINEGETLPEADLEYLAKAVIRINDAVSYSRRSHGR